MTINETRLLDTYIGITYGLDIISEIEGKRVFWNYHRSFDNYRPVCSYSDATFIGVHAQGFNNNLTVISMRKKNRNHPTVAKILAAFKEEELYACEYHAYECDCEKCLENCDEDGDEIDTKPAQHINMVDYAAKPLEH